MTAFFKIIETESNGTLFIHEYSNNKDMYFQFRGEIEPAPARSDATDYGQYWITNQDPTKTPMGQAIYNPSSQSLLGTIGIGTEANKGELLGGVTFLSTKYNGRFVFNPAAGMPNTFNINLVNDDLSVTTYYICYLTETDEVAIVDIENLSTPPTGAITTWRIEFLNNNVPTHN